MQLFQKFEMWDHTNCTIPNHRMQCLTLTLDARKKLAWKPDFPSPLPEMKELTEDDALFLTEETISNYPPLLSDNFIKEDVEAYWRTWTLIAEEWLLQKAAITNGNPEIGENKKFKGRGFFRLERKQVNKKAREVSDEGDFVDSGLSSLFKIRRILEEVVCKAKKSNTPARMAETIDLWNKARRIAFSDCQVAAVNLLLRTERVPGTPFIECIILEINNHISQRGAQLKRMRLRQYDTQRKEEIRTDPSRAFACLRPDRDLPLSALKRDDGTITGNIQEMDQILRKNGVLSSASILLTTLRQVLTTS